MLYVNYISINLGKNVGGEGQMSIGGENQMLFQKIPYGGISILGSFLGSSVEWEALEDTAQPGSYGKRWSQLLYTLLWKSDPWLGDMIDSGAQSNG